MARSGSRAGSKSKRGVGLSPSQAAAYARLEESLGFARVIGIWGETGFGKTTLLKALAQKRFRKAPLLSTRDFLARMKGGHPLRLEESYAEMLQQAVKKHEVVLLDDIHLLNDAVCCHHFYPRTNYFSGPLTAVLEEAELRGRTLVATSKGNLPAPFHKRGYYFGVKQLAEGDYALILGAYLPRKLSSGIDYAKLYRFAPKLNGHQLRGAAEELASKPSLSTEQLIEYVRARRMASNVDLAEVQAVDLRSLKGLDDLLESLEANVVLPFENDTLATELKIKPKRGVLLIGPPGTGKTTVGRAMAHRLKSKFFLIDGTFISGTQAFYQKIQQVTEAAKQNAPSIIFIDDSDVIFEQGREQGLYRYLLTMLDGIESDTAGRVCVMMTAMDVGSLPPALIRSGRIELWLETRLPDLAARSAILEDLVAELPAGIARPDVSQLAAATEGMTGADLKRLIEDGKILFGYDQVRGRTLKPSTEYFVSAIEKVQANKLRYAEAEQRARLAQAQRMPNPYEQYGYAGMEEEDSPA